MRNGNDSKSMDTAVKINNYNASELEYDESIIILSQLLSPGVARKKRSTCTVDKDNFDINISALISQPTSQLHNCCLQCEGE